MTMTEPNAPNDLLDDGFDRVRDVARFLKVSVSHVYLLMEQRKLPYLKLGKSRRIPHRAVLDLAARHLVGGTEA
jgi:excisionase family DNA binding protein